MSNVPVDPEVSRRSPRMLQRNDVVHTSEFDDAEVREGVGEGPAEVSGQDKLSVGRLSMPDGEMLTRIDWMLHDEERKRLAYFAHVERDGAWTAAETDAARTAGGQPFDDGFDGQTEEDEGTDKDEEGRAGDFEHELAASEVWERRQNRYPVSDGASHSARSCSL